MATNPLFPVYHRPFLGKGLSAACTLIFVGWHADLCLVRRGKKVLKVGIQPGQLLTEDLILHLLLSPEAIHWIAVVTSLTGMAARVVVVLYPPHRSQNLNLWRETLPPFLFSEAAQPTPKHQLPSIPTKCSIHGTPPALPGTGIEPVRACAPGCAEPDLNRYEVPSGGFSCHFGFRRQKIPSSRRTPLPVALWCGLTRIRCSWSGPCLHLLPNLTGGQVGTVWPLHVPHGHHRASLGVGSRSDKV